MSHPSPLQCVLDPNAHFLKTVTIHNTLTPRQAQRMLQEAPLSPTERRIVFQNYEQELDALKYHCYTHTRGGFKKSAAKMLAVAPLYGGATATNTVAHARHMRKIMHLYDTQNVLAHTNYVRGQLAGGRTPTAASRHTHAVNGDAGGNTLKTKKKKTAVVNADAGNTQKKKKKKAGRTAFTDDDIIVAEVAEKTMLHRLREEGVCDLMVKELSKGLTNYMNETFSETTQVEQVVYAKHSRTNEANQTGWMSKLKEWGGGVLAARPTVWGTLKVSAKWSLRGSLWMFNFMIQHPAHAAFFLLFVKIILRTWCRNVMTYVGHTKMVDEITQNYDEYSNLKDLGVIGAQAFLKNFMKHGFKSAFLSATSCTLRLVKSGLFGVPIVGRMLAEVCQIFTEMAGEAIKTAVEFQLYQSQLNDNWKQIVSILNLLTSECLVEVQILDPVHKKANQLLQLKELPVVHIAQQFEP